MCVQSERWLQFALLQTFEQITWQIMKLWYFRSYLEDLGINNWKNVFKEPWVKEIYEVILQYGLPI